MRMLSKPGLMLYSSIACLAATNTAFANPPINPYSEGVRAELAEDYQGAINAYLEAADAGASDAMFALGRVYGDVYGDSSAAFNWYLDAARAGNHFAQQAVGVAYRDGVGTAPDQEQARRWLEAAAVQGHLADAAFDIFALDPQARNATRWLQVAATGGNVEAMERLADAYETGDMGLLPNGTESARWRQAVREAQE